MRWYALMRAGWKARGEYSELMKGLKRELRSLPSVEYGRKLPRSKYGLEREVKTRVLVQGKKSAPRARTIAKKEQATPALDTHFLIQSKKSVRAGSQEKPNDKQINARAPPQRQRQAQDNVIETNKLNQTSQTMGMPNNATVKKDSSNPTHPEYDGVLETLRKELDKRANGEDEEDDNNDENDELGTNTSTRTTKSVNARQQNSVKKSSTKQRFNVVSVNDEDEDELHKESKELVKSLFKELGLGQSHERPSHQQPQQKLDAETTKQQNEVIPNEKSNGIGIWNILILVMCAVVLVLATLLAIVAKKRKSHTSANRHREEQDEDVEDGDSHSELSDFDDKPEKRKRKHTGKRNRRFAVADSTSDYII